MPDQLQLRGGTTSEHSSFTGALREVTVDTTKKTLVVHDGSQAGGTPLMKESGTVDPTTILIGTGGAQKLEITNSAVVFNQVGADVDFRIEGANEENLFKIDAANDRIGIGITTPQVLMHLHGSNARFQFTNSSTGTGAADGVITGLNGDQDFFINNREAGKNLLFFSNNTSALTIDGNQNMGLGVTPNANWPSNGDTRAFQIGSGALLFGRSTGDEDRGGIAVNYYSDGSNNKFLANGHAARIYMNDGRIDFQNTAAANTNGAAAALTFATPMCILPSGRVGIGTTAPESGYNLDIHGAGAPSLRVKDTDVTNSYAVLSHNHGASYILTRSNTSFGTFQLYQHDGTTLKTTLNVQATGQINHLGPLIFTKNNAANSYNASLAVADGSIAIRGDLGGGNYWGWRTRAVASGSVSDANAIKKLPSINDFQYPNNSNGMLIASTSKIGFAAGSESPQYSNGVQMLFDSNGLALGSGNAFDHTHGSTTSANANVVIKTSGNIVFKAGKGIDFSATGNSAGSMSSELFADYEKGSWTPVFTDDGTSGNSASSYDRQLGWYCRTGDLVNVQIRISNAVFSGFNTSHAAYIKGLPFPIQNDTGRLVTGTLMLSNVNLDSDTMSLGVLANVGGGVSNSFFRLFQSKDNAVWTSVPISTFTSGANEILVNFSYLTDG